MKCARLLLDKFASRGHQHTRSSHHHHQGRDAHNRDPIHKEGNRWAGGDAHRRSGGHRGSNSAVGSGSSSSISVKSIEYSPLSAPLSLLSWSIDRSETTTFAPVAPPKPASHYFKAPRPSPGVNGPVYLPCFGEVEGIESLDEIQTIEDFERIFSEEKGWSVVRPAPGQSFLTPNHRRRRIAKEQRLERICRVITREGPDVLCLQDADVESMRVIEALRFPPHAHGPKKGPKVQMQHQEAAVLDGGGDSPPHPPDSLIISPILYRYAPVGQVTISGTGLACSFVKVLVTAEGTAARDGAAVAADYYPQWSFETLHIGMPYVTFTLRRSPDNAAAAGMGGGGSVRRRDAVTITNMDLTPVVKDLGMEHSTPLNKKGASRIGAVRLSSPFGPKSNRPRSDDEERETDGDADDDELAENSDLNRNFYKNLRNSLPPAARVFDKNVDNFTTQREASLALLARGSQRLYTPVCGKGVSAGAAAAIVADDVSVGRRPTVPDIIIGNSHLRHGWTIDRMRLVMPHYADAWEAAGRPDGDWESYAFYPSGSSSSGGKSRPTNHRYFADSDGDTAAAASPQQRHASRAKGGRYERCFLHRSLVYEPPPSAQYLQKPPSSSSASNNNSSAPPLISYKTLRPMMDGEKDCSCADQFPIVVTLK